MIKRIYGIYDVKTGFYGPSVMVLINDGEALRIVTDEVNLRQESMLNRHPEDYRLDFLGEFNTNTGEINTVLAPKYVVDLAQLKKLEGKK